jgi:hypothetical protein
MARCRRAAALATTSDCFLRMESLRRQVCPPKPRLPRGPCPAPVEFHVRYPRAAASSRSSEVTMKRGLGSLLVHSVLANHTPLAAPAVERRPREVLEAAGYTPRPASLALRRLSSRAILATKGLVLYSREHHGTLNMTSGNGLSVTYTAFNKPAAITRGTASIAFRPRPRAPALRPDQPLRRHLLHRRRRRAGRALRRLRRHRALDQLVSPLMVSASTMDNRQRGPLR